MTTVAPTTDQGTYDLVHPTAFLSSDFSPSSYISNIRSFVPLETLADELISHLTSLNSDLIDLVNRDYADFVELGTRFAGAGDAATRTHAPLAELRAKMAALHGAAATQLVELRVGMERHAVAACRELHMLKERQGPK